MKRAFLKVAKVELEKHKLLTPGILSEDDLKNIPSVVRKYIRYTGAIGKEKVISFRTEFRGGIRFSADEEYMNLRSVQYNFMDDPARLFFIIAKKKGIPVQGLHIYRNGRATFKIKLLGLLTLVNASGPQMDQGETVTVFNDMCFIAPATLIDERIEWEVKDDLVVKATFRNGKISITADLFFNEEGELINFISNDRFETRGKDYYNYPWSTPVLEYADYNGYRRPSKAQLIFSRPDGDFSYGEFELINTEFNFRDIH
jgi:hypothetical protein